MRLFCYDTSEYEIMISKHVIIQSRKPPLAVVSPDTLAAVLINHSTTSSTTSSSRIFVEPTNIARKYCRLYET